jgi:hypothetical protein
MPTTTPSIPSGQLPPPRSGTYLSDGLEAQAGPGVTEGGDSGLRLESPGKPGDLNISAGRVPGGVAHVLFATEVHVVRKTGFEPVTAAM